MRIFFIIPFALLVSNIYLFANHNIKLKDSASFIANGNQDWWNVIHYKINIEILLEEKKINGNVLLTFKAEKSGHHMQIDLQKPLIIDSVFEVELISYKYKRKKERKIALEFKSENSGYSILLKKSILKNQEKKILIYYHGKPHEAINAPWDGGLVWTKDSMGLPFISLACEDIGASVWMPCKDLWSDEPENGISMHIQTPKHLVAVSNGKLISTTLNKDDTKTWNWEVKSPINLYNINFTIGNLVNWNSLYKSKNGNLDIGYWVLAYHLQKAKKHFNVVPQMLNCFEHWFGPYPFYKDGYKLIETPFLGMEHQSAIAYGNEFKFGYKGKDLSNSGWGLKWDFIIVHESGHEWFGNNMTAKHRKDMWIHESFTNYSETLFTEYLFGKKAGNDYCFGTRQNIKNEYPLVSMAASYETDIYYKGGNMIHTIRNAMFDDKKFRFLLRGMNAKFYHKTISTKDVLTYFTKFYKFPFKYIFDQYLNTIQIPVLLYTLENDKISFKWSNCVEGFNLPLVILLNGQLTKIYPTKNHWKTFRLNPKDQYWWHNNHLENHYYIKVNNANSIKIF